MLGWKILDKGEYGIGLPRLSDEEEKLIEDTEEQFKQKTRDRSISEEETEELMKNLVFDYADKNGIYIDNKQAEYLTRVAVFHIYGFGFLEPLLKDKSIEEISVVGVNKPVYVFIRNKGWQTVNACFTDEKAIMDIINRMARSIGRRITYQNPRIDAMLPDGSRLHASLKPVSDGEITIRKFRENPFSPKELCDNKTLSNEALSLLSLIMQGDNSVLVAGNTASGKTTTLNALFSFVPMKERIVITEETPEINIPHEHQLRLVANRDMGISLNDLVYDSLRVRPDRTIVGEVRNKEEIEALFDVILGGQARGSYATFHAQSANEAIQRLKSFGINEMDVLSLDYILVQRRMLRYKDNTEVRRVVEIMDVKDRKSAFVYDLKKDKLVQKDNLVERIGEKLGMSKKETLQEIGRREKMFRKLDNEFSGCFSSIQKGLFGYDV